MSVLIYAQTSTNIAAVVYPASGIADAALQTKVVPSGITSYIVADSVIPTDLTFRNAWEVAGGGTAIQIDLVKAKAIGHADIRACALTAIEVSEQKTSLGETPTYTPAQIETAHTAAKAAITADTTAANIKTEIDSFISTYG